MANAIVFLAWNILFSSCKEPRTVVMVVGSGAVLELRDYGWLISSFNSGHPRPIIFPCELEISNFRLARSFGLWLVVRLRRVLQKVTVSTFSPQSMVSTASARSPKLSKWWWNMCKSNHIQNIGFIPNVLTISYRWKAFNPPDKKEKGCSEGIHDLFLPDFHSHV